MVVDPDEYIRLQSDLLACRMRARWALEQYGVELNVNRIYMNALMKIDNDIAKKALKEAKNVKKRD